MKNVSWSIYPNRRETSQSANSNKIWCQIEINALKEIKQGKVMENGELGVGASLVSQKKASLRMTFVWSADWYERTSSVNLWRRLIS